LAADLRTRRILVTGGSGQIGLELARCDWPETVEVEFPDRSVLDLTSEQSIAAIFRQARWDGVINCAAWTAVDAAEDHAAEAYLINSEGAARLAREARGAVAAFVQVSTDYVFDGALGRPYREDDQVNPLGAYGASKLSGELRVREAHPDAVIVRTGWVLSAHRHNFLKTMLRLASTEPVVRVVEDQRGCPTGARDMAEALKAIMLRLVEGGDAPTGTYHFANAGEASWFELASAIFAIAGSYGDAAPRTEAIPTSEYKTRARRPADSRLDTGRLSRDYDIRPRPWREVVEDIIRELHLTNRPAGENR